MTANVISMNESSFEDSWGLKVFQVQYKLLKTFNPVLDYLFPSKMAPTTNSEPESLLKAHQEITRSLCRCLNQYFGTYRSPYGHTAAVERRRLEESENIRTLYLNFLNHLPMFTDAWTESAKKKLNGSRRRQINTRVFFVSANGPRI